MSFDTEDAERNAGAILKVLSDTPEPLGSRNISRRLEESGIRLTERAVRFHLKHFDDTGLTELAPRRAGRTLTATGQQEARVGRVRDRIGFALTRIHGLAFRADFDPRGRCGLIPVSISFLPEEEFDVALHAMEPVFESGLGTSDLVAFARQGESLGGVLVPGGKVAFATVCSIVVNATLLKAGIPTDARFGGIVEMRRHEPLRFVEAIHYAGTSIDPGEVFLSAKMTDVRGVATSGNGRLLASFHEIAAVCRKASDDVIAGLEEAGLRGVLVKGETSRPVCEAPVGLDRIGVILLDGLNPVAAAQEAGIRAENRPMSTVLDYQQLIPFRQLLS